jgi:hypothetical protein
VLNSAAPSHAVPLRPAEPAILPVGAMLLAASAATSAPPLGRYLARLTLGPASLSYSPRGEFVSEICGNYTRRKVYGIPPRVISLEQLPNTEHRNFCWALPISSLPRSALGAALGRAPIIDKFTRCHRLSDQLDRAGGGPSDAPGIFAEGLTFEPIAALIEQGAGEKYGGLGPFPLPSMPAAR